MNRYMIHVTKDNTRIKIEVASEGVYISFNDEPATLLVDSFLGKKRILWMPLDVDAEWVYDVDEGKFTE